MNNKLSELRAKAMQLPLCPGVYIMKNKDGKIIYIGKAKALKNRVSQYFGSQNNHSEKVRQMVENVDYFEYIVVDSEFESLILECSLIKQHTPKYNILLKDDKGFHYIKITKPPYSRISECKKVEKDGAKYLGPYTYNFSVKQAVEDAVKVFKLPTCSRVFPRDIGKNRPCLNYFINQCCGVCTGKVEENDYNEAVADALAYLQGGGDSSIKMLTKRMEDFAENLEFEKAAKIRDKIAALKNVYNKQKVVASKVQNQDVITLSLGSKTNCFEVFRFSSGRLYDREHFFVDNIDTPANAKEEFITQYYTMRNDIPPQITMDDLPENSELLTSWLSSKRGKNVKIVVPQKGEQFELVKMCKANGAEHIASKSGIRGKDATALEELSSLLGLDFVPSYIESYDISNIAGSENVAGMIVFENGKPLKSAYRKFKIKDFVGQDDYGSMKEVITRRLNEYEKNKENNEGFGKLPDLILLDGGKGHVGVIKPLIKQLGYDIPVFGMVKDDKHKTRAITSEGQEISITSKRSAFTLVSTIQEEVHRFAIGFHRNSRSKNAFSTSLLEIESIGKTRAKELLKRFKTIGSIKEASVEELASVKGMNSESAFKVYRYYHGEKEE